MRKILSLAVVLAMLLALAGSALAAEATVYVTVSIDGEIKLAAAPVTVSELTVAAVLKEAHKAYYSGGESGLTAGPDPSFFNMYMVSKCWGVEQIPFMIVNDNEPVGNPTADAYAVKDGDNIVIAIATDPENAPAKAIALKADVDGNNATITATEWVLDFMTFTYSTNPYANAEVFDAETGASLGTTDANGKATVAIPASGKIAVGGWAAIAVKGTAAPAPGDDAPAPAPGDDAPAPAPGDDAPAPAPGDEPAGPSLPRTSADGLYLTVFGLLLITAGVVLFRRTKLCR